MTERPNVGLAGFLTMAFVIVGLAGIFSTYAVRAPLMAALGREAVLDQVLAAGEGPDAPVALAALRPALGARADAVLEGPGTLAERVARERRRVLARADAEGTALANRVRIVIGGFTIAAAIFGFAILGVGRRR